MCYLTLYVDKWYIVGAINTGNTFISVCNQGSDDRFWLYFHNDISNNRIDFGRRFQKNYLHQNPDYYGDVFSKIIDSEQNISCYNGNQPFKEIFRLSGLFHLLKKNIENIRLTARLPVYLSFGTDINAYGKELFKGELKNNLDIDLKAYASSLELLALNYLKGTRSDGFFRENEYTLVLNATNENLHIGLYLKDESGFRLENNRMLKGYGIDFRKQTISMLAVRTLNNLTHFLTDKNEEQEEIQRISDDYADGWLNQLEESRSGVILVSMAFSMAPYNKHNIYLKKDIIDEGTRSIIYEIVSDIKRFFDESTIGYNRPDKVVFFGDIFDNTQFREAFKNWLILQPDDNLLQFWVRDIPRLVSGYQYLNPDKKEADEYQMFQELPQELKDAMLLNTDTNTEKVEKDRLYNEAMKEAEQYEIGKNYPAMCTALNKALENKPGDQLALEKLERAKRLQIELNNIKDNQNNNIIQYNNRIKTANNLFNNQDWEKAKIQYKLAIEIDSTQNYPKRQIKIIDEKLETQKQINLLISIARMQFYDNKAYGKAIEKLKEAQILDPDNTTVNSLLKQVQTIQIQAVNTKIRALDQAEGAGDYITAINICLQLKQLDAEHSDRWDCKLSELKGQGQNVYDQPADSHIDQVFADQVFADQVNQIRSRIDTGNWQSASDSLLKIRKLAKNTSEKNIWQEFYNQISAFCERQIKYIQRLIAQGKLDEAETLLETITHNRIISSNRLQEVKKQLKKARTEEVSPDSDSAIDGLIKKYISSEKTFDQDVPDEKEEDIILSLYNKACDIYKVAITELPHTRMKEGNNELMLYVYKASLNEYSIKIGVKVHLSERQDEQEPYWEHHSKWINQQISASVDIYNPSFDNPPLETLQALLFCIAEIYWGTKMSEKEFEEYEKIKSIEKSTDRTKKAMAAFLLNCHALTIKAWTVEAYGEFKMLNEKGNSDPHGYQQTTAWKELNMTRRKWFDYMHKIDWSNSSLEWNGEIPVSASSFGEAFAWSNRIFNNAKTQLVKQLGEVSRKI